MLQCLLLSDTLFAKGLDEILMNMRNGYYVCLLKLPSLGGFHNTHNMRFFLEKHFMALAHGKELPPIPGALAPPAPAELPAIMDQPQILAIEEAPYPPSVPLPAVDSVAVYGIRPVRYNKNGMNIDVYFDNCTSGTGKRRCFSTCDHKDHESEIGRCERAVFVEDFQGNPSLAAAFMVAWRLCADQCGSKGEHLHNDPESSTVNVIAEELSNSA